MAAPKGAVFLDGNRLSERFAALADGDRFVIGETGFGTGLNMLLAAALFRQRAPAGRGWICSRWSAPARRRGSGAGVAAWPDGADTPEWDALRDALRRERPPASPGATGCGWRTTSP